MMEELTALQLRDGIAGQQYSSVEATQAVFEHIEQREENIGAFITTFSEPALTKATEVDRKIAAGEKVGSLAGVPIAIKDNFCTRFGRTTCASKILENFAPPYDAHVVEKLEAAGAVIIGETEGRREILSYTYGCELNIDALVRPMSGVREFPTVEGIEKRRQFVKMEGRAIYSFAVRKFHDEILNSLEKAGLTIEDLDYVVPHQVNIRIIKSAVERLNFPIEKVYINIDRYGNSSAGTIPVALAEAYQEGWFKEGDIICIVAFGGGLTWGAEIIRW